MLYTPVITYVIPIILCVSLRVWEPTTPPFPRDHVVFKSVLYTLFTMITLPNYWTLYSGGQRYTFDTYRELAKFSQKLSDERRQRFEQNVQPYL